MKNELTPSGTSAERTVPETMRSGFTLIEVIFASTMALFLFLVMLEALFFCRRSAANLKWQLAADALAYDAAMEIFNRQTTWFEANVTGATAAWSKVPEERTSVWIEGREAFLFKGIYPDASPATSWRIVTDVRWPLPDGKSRTLSKPCVVERHRANRNLFRNTL